MFQKILKTLINFLNKFVKEPSVTKVTSDITTNNEITPQLEVKELSHEDSIFLHTRSRVRERYGLTITQADYIRWVGYIKNKTKQATYIIKRPSGASLYRIMHGNIDVVVLYKDNLIYTAYPYDDEMARLANKNKMAVKSGKASKNVGRGILK